MFNYDMKFKSLHYKKFKYNQTNVNFIRIKVCVEKFYRDQNMSL